MNWKKLETIRQKEASAGNIDFYYYPEDKIWLRSKKEIEAYS